MSNNDSPITPPPELIDGLKRDVLDGYSSVPCALRAAYRAGVDQGLEACCEWLISHGWFGSSNHDAIRGLRAALRPPTIPETIEVDGHTYRLVK